MGAHINIWCQDHHNTFVCIDLDAPDDGEN
jgi:hypothetical protein